MLAVDRYVSLYRQQIATERSLLETARADGSTLNLEPYGSLADLFAFEGCSVEQTHAVGEVWGGSVPNSIEAFLLIFGLHSLWLRLPFKLSYPAVLEASDALLSWQQSLTADLGPEWVDQNSDRFQLPPHVCHLGPWEGGQGVFYFFEDHVADPAVWVIDEGAIHGPAVHRTGRKFSEHVVDSLKAVRWRSSGS